MLKRSAFVALTLFLLPSFVFAEEVIRDFSVRVHAQADRTVTIVENITYDFGDTARHGIFRVIPERYMRDGTAYNLRFTVTEVTMDGAPVPFDVTRTNGSIRFKIGDPNTTVTGRHVYSISYRTDRALNFFDDHSEFYWNVTGNDWDVEIERASFSFLLPENLLVTPQNVRCFTGPYGSMTSECTILEELGGATFVTDDRLPPSEGLSIVIALPAGAILAPTSLDRVQMIVTDNFHFAIPFFAIIVMVWLWVMRGRDPKPDTIIPIYEPPEKLRPGEMAAIRDEGAFPNAAVTATILDLAVRGYLRIRGERKNEKHFGTRVEFTLIKKRDVDTTLNGEERALMKGIFVKDEVMLTEIKGERMSGPIRVARSEIRRRMKMKKLFIGSPVAIRAGAISAAFLIGGLLVVTLAQLPLGVIVGLVTGFIIAIVGWFMPRRTKQGVQLYVLIKGFEWFLRVTEQDRLAFHNAPHKTPELFFDMLPYAVALGLDREWAGQFKDMEISQPVWAEGKGWSATHPAVFVSSMRSFSRAAGSAYHRSSAGSGTSGFSGGGSSGGGFGGGGGGSW